MTAIKQFLFERSFDSADGTPLKDAKKNSGSQAKFKPGFHDKNDLAHLSELDKEGEEEES